MGGSGLVRSALAGRASYDPRLADLARRNLGDLLAAAASDAPGRWRSIGSRSPQTLVLDLETALAVLADFPDLKSPYFAGHARAVSALGAAADPGHAELLRCAAEDRYRAETGHRADISSPGCARTRLRSPLSAPNSRWPAPWTPKRSAPAPKPPRG